jgi:two-component system, OmpR family, sensor kinase
VARGHAELIRASGLDGQVATDAAVVLDELGRLSNLSERLLILTAAEDRASSPLPTSRSSRSSSGSCAVGAPTATRSWRVRVTAERTIRADRERLETALDALMENALNATDEGDEIRVGCRGEGDVVVLEVSDNGRGIRADDLPRIFERFSKLGSDRSRRNGGTGLGLSIAKAIVDAHGGSIEVESEEGHGATFRISLSGFHAVPA